MQAETESERTWHFHFQTHTWVLCKHTCNNHYSGSIIKLNQATGNTHQRPLAFALHKNKWIQKGMHWNKAQQTRIESDRDRDWRSSSSNLSSIQQLHASMHQLNFIGSQLTRLFDCVHFANASKVLGPIKCQTFNIIDNRRQNMKKPSPNKLVAKYDSTHCGSDTDDELEQTILNQH